MEKMSTSIHPLGYHSIFFIAPFALHFDKEALLTQGECGTATIHKCSNPSVIGQHPRTQFFEAHRICHEILDLSRSRCIGQKRKPCCGSNADAQIPATNQNSRGAPKAKLSKSGHPRHDRKQIPTKQRISPKTLEATSTNKTAHPPSEAVSVTNPDLYRIYQIAAQHTAANRPRHLVEQNIFPHFCTVGKQNTKKYIVLF